jgi:predicted acetyltransferase
MPDPDQGAEPARHAIRPPRLPSAPVTLSLLDRSHRALLENLGQLYRHDLSEAYGQRPNPDGTFNNRRLDRYLTGDDSSQQMWLITVEDGLGGFVLTRGTEDGGSTISDFFVVRALRRTGVGREAARQVIAMTPGRWRIGFQSYNPGAERFWTLVATDVAPNSWRTFDDAQVEGRPPDSWITFETRMELGQGEA